MKISEADILILPGLGNSGEGHWQLRWAERFSTGRIVQQDEWDRPRLADWVARIHQDIMLATRPVVLVAHSLACCAVVHTAQNLKDAKVRGALLVSPPDLENDGLIDELPHHRHEVMRLVSRQGHGLPRAEGLIYIEADPCRHERTL